MPHIDIRRSHTLGRAEVRALATSLAADLEREYGVRTRWDGDVLRVKGRGVTGEIHAAADAIRVVASLGMLVRPLRGRLEQEIERVLDEQLAS